MNCDHPARSQICTLRRTHDLPCDLVNFSTSTLPRHAFRRYVCHYRQGTLRTSRNIMAPTSGNLLQRRITCAFLWVIISSLSRETAAVTCSAASDCSSTQYCYDGYLSNTCTACSDASYPCNNANSLDDDCANCISPCDASSAPTNGGVGDCTSSLASGSTCQPTCDTGYTVSGTTSCNAGILTAATCAAATCSAASDCSSTQYCYDGYLSDTCTACSDASYPCNNANSLDDDCANCISPTPSTPTPSTPTPSPPLAQTCPTSAEECDSMCEAQGFTNGHDWSSPATGRPDCLCVTTSTTFVAPTCTTPTPSPPPPSPPPPSPPPPTSTTTTPTSGSPTATSGTQSYRIQALCVSALAICATLLV